MRDKVIYGLGGITAVLLVWNIYMIFLGTPDELNQGAVARIVTFHIPAAMAASMAVFIALVCSILYLVTKNIRYDAVAVSVTEVGLAMGAINLITGSIWGRIIWGIWWTWDARLTSMLISWLMYAGYLILRQAIDEPTQRARYAAVLSILSFPGVIITYMSIKWFRTQHPGPVFESRGGGGFGPFLAPIMWNMVAMILLSIVLTLIRERQETYRRELDGMRREAHAL